ncbi:MAG: hydrogenase nickel incorporation protein HypA/HybF [Desulforhopalus sp.]|jgi:hydrogenase nickel incorporation protein HypA/HybF
MHEFSLAQGLHTQLMDLVRAHEMKTVRMVEVSIGSSAGIVEESFLFGFNVLAEQYEETKGLNVVVIHDDSSDLILQRVELE